MEDYGVKIQIKEAAGVFVETWVEENIIGLKIRSTNPETSIRAIMTAKEAERIARFIQEACDEITKKN